MTASVFEIFKIGVGPSSSHTMGPMLAAARFAERVAPLSPARLLVDLYGSLALTGKGHATDRAVMLGLAGMVPETLDAGAAEAVLSRIASQESLPLAGGAEIAFRDYADIVWHQRDRLAYHTNGLRFTALDEGGVPIAQATFFSVGGGIIVEEGEMAEQGANGPADAPVLPYPFRSGAELLEKAEEARLSLCSLAMANELAMHTQGEVDQRLDTIANAMMDCVERGMKGGGILPGGLKVKRRAGDVHATLVARQERALADPLSVLDWVNLWALAVNEENAAGGRVVTAPTNGAAGIVPAVLRYYRRFVPGADDAGTRRFLLVAALIGSLFKENASISGAEVGCQGEVGVACSMAAAGLAAVLGGTNAQIENAAEIGMEHNLGLTCDPVGGLVQVPCIERNAVGAVKAIEAARLALLGDGTHRVSLDEVIETMRRTGADMSDRYKETSLGGLAVNVVAC
ncbi:MAG: L-serine ammonia-lyase [Sphingomonadales bacterium]|nr:L-serine ammonia-lyase [Sphingomonadales bacterium]MDE2169169.1 L-serine ammonia-lyase [Sphingomonadales bacterium]